MEKHRQVLTYGIEKNYQSTNQSYFGYTYDVHFRCKSKITAIAAGGYLNI